MIDVPSFAWRELMKLATWLRRPGPAPPIVAAFLRSTLMIRTTPRLLACALALIAAPAMAGPLATDGTAYFDGTFHWHGTSAFNSGGGLSGTVDWAVYGPGTAPAGFAGYPTSATEVLYTYQIYVTGTDDVSGLSVHVQNPAHDPGTFTATGISGDVPYDSSLTVAPGDATWSFFGILAPNSSTGLVFTSPNVPMFDNGTLVDGGQSALIAVPSTSPLHIPEPGTLTLLVCGAAAVGFQQLRRSVRRARS
jgi:hypothetical protein